VTLELKVIRVLRGSLSQTSSIEISASALALMYQVMDLWHTAAMALHGQRYQPSRSQILPWDLDLPYGLREQFQQTVLVL